MGGPSAPPGAAADAPQVAEVRPLAGLRTVSLWTFASRLLGLVRDMAMAALFGNGAALDAFTVAFRIPNLARRLFGEGALAAAFLPSFTREMEQSGRPAASRFGTAMLVALACFLTALVLVGESLLLVAWLSGAGEGASALLVGLTAALLPYLVLICGSALVGTMLQAVGRFGWPAMLPVMLNVVWLVALWALWNAPLSDAAKLHWLCGAIVASGVVQFAAPLPALRRAGFRFDRQWPRALNQVRGVARGMVPVLLGLSISQLNALADSLIAWGFSQPEGIDIEGATAGWSLPAGTASALYFGQRMYQFPLGVFGVALGTVMFPLFARHAGRGRLDLLRDDVTLGMRLVLFIGFPASLGLVLLAEPLTALLFQRGRFGPDDVRQTAAMIAAYGAGVWVHCGLLIAQRAFYSLGDRIAPLRAGLVAVAVNLALDFALLWPMGGTGLAAATSIAAIVQLGLTLWLLQKASGTLIWRPLTATAILAALSCAALAVAVIGTMALIDNLAAAAGTMRLLRLGVPLAAGAAVYFLAAWLLRMEETRFLLGRTGGRE